MKISFARVLLAATITFTAQIAPAFAAGEAYVLNGKPISEDQYFAAKMVQESMTALDGGNFAEALEKARAAKAKAPNFYYAIAAVGICAARSGNYDEAIDNLRQSLALHPDQPETLWSLGATLQSAGRTAEAIVQLKQFLAKYPKNSRSPQGIALVDLLEKQIKMNSKITIHSDQDYFAEAVGLRVMRWSDKDIPIKIYIADPAKVEGYKPSYAAQLQEALKDWEAVSDGKVKFEQVDSAANANITFHWSDNPKDVSNAAEGGEARLVPLGNSLGAVRLVVLTVNNMPGLKLSDRVILFICLHELGHALGIGGHSQSPGDIMYSSLPLNYEHFKLSDRDARTLIKLYSTEVANTAETVAAKNLMSVSDITNATDISAINTHGTAAMNAKDYSRAVEIFKGAVAKYPDSAVMKRNLAAALNNSGLMALSAQQFDKALDIFQQALVLNPDNKPAKTNIAVAHYNTGLIFLRQNKLPEAENALKQAMDGFESAGNQMLLVKAANNYAVVLKRLGRDDEAHALEAKYKVTGI